MSDKYDIYDDRGRKIGEAERQLSPFEQGQRAGQEIAGMAILLYLLWKALPFLLVIGALIFCLTAGVAGFQAAGLFVQYGTFDQREANLRASATAVAKDNVARLAQAEDALKNQDYYLAASIARVVLQKEPTNKQVVEFLQRISDRVSGGLVVGGRSGIYHPFGRADTVTFIEGLGGDLVGISPDGRRGLIQNRDTYSVMNFADSRIASLDRGKPSPDLNKVEMFDIGAGIVFQPMKIKNVLNGRIREIGCTAYDHMDRWMRDSRLITQIGNEGIIIVDTESGTCRSVKVPGLSRGNVSAALTDGQRIWIVLPGSFSSVKDGQLFVVNMDGSGLRKITDLPIRGRQRDSREFLSPDSSAIYLSEGLMVSTRTGRVVEAIGNAVGWVESDPLRASVKGAQLTVQPRSGPRGTRFVFQLEGGEPGMEVALSIKRGNDFVDGGWVYWVDSNGRITDSPNYQFGYKTGINTATGTYTATIVSTKSRMTIATVNFIVAEP